MRRLFAMPLHRLRNSERPTVPRFGAVRRTDEATLDLIELLGAGLLRRHRMRSASNRRVPRSTLFAL